MVNVSGGLMVAATVGDTVVGEVDIVSTSVACPSLEGI
jgi:hypothetical protein